MTAQNTKQRPRRSHTIRINIESDAFRQLLRIVPDYDRPVTRADCVDGPRPCPFLACRHNISADFLLRRDHRGKPVENIRLVHAGEDDPTDIEPPDGNNCALDYAEKGGMTLEEVGAVFGITRERIRQIEEVALRQVRRASARPPIDAATQRNLRELFKESGDEPRPDRTFGGMGVETKRDVFMTGTAGTSKKRRL